MQTIAQIAGIGWCAVIMICVIWSLATYIISSIDRPGKRNKKLQDNMNKMNK